LRDGDTWVMLGDSITAQHLHTNYIEAFCYARYPTLTFHFRNSGVSGDTIPRALDRFAWDVAAWKPTLVSVELGMNDKGGFPVEKYIGNMGKLSEKITALGARPVFITASPINSGETMAKLGSNAALNVYAMALKNFAAAQNAPYADQFHALIDVWGRNKPRENLANLIKAGEVMARDNDLRGVESLRAFLAEQGKDSHPPVSMQGDTVHPGPPGQLMMAAAILKDLHAEGFVSSLTLDATGKVLQSKGCVVENVQAAAGKLSFDRLDQCLPFPIHNEARVVLPLCPAVLELSQYSLQISGLPGGQYALDVNGKRLATLDAQELAAGVNLTAYGQGPIEDQGHTIVGLVGAKENLVGQWRTLAKMVAIGNGNADIARQMEKLRKSIDEADARIRREAQPRQLHFLVVPIGQARS
jgi:lysophospholipase L1-like esterase